MKLGAVLCAFLSIVVHVLVHGTREGQWAVSPQSAQHSAELSAYGGFQYHADCPLLQKWGIPIQRVKEEFQFTSIRACRTVVTDLVLVVSVGVNATGGLIDLSQQCWQWVVRVILNLGSCLPFQLSGD